MLLLFLRVHKYISYFNECIRGNEALQKKVFYSACTSYHFRPAADDPYGMTKESLTGALEEVFGDSALLNWSYRSSTSRSHFFFGGCSISGHLIGATFEDVRAGDNL